MDHWRENEPDRHAASSRPASATQGPAANDDRAFTSADAELQGLRAEVASLQRKLAVKEAALADVTSLYDESPFGHLCLSRIGHIKALNNTAVAMLGEERSGIVGRSFVRYLTAESRTNFYVLLRTCNLNGKASCLVRLQRGGEAGQEIELISARNTQQPDGSACHVLMIEHPGVHSVLLSRSAAGREKATLARAVRVLEGQHYDLEGQYHRLLATQRLLQESRDRYAELYDFAPIGYLSMDDSGCMRVLNLTTAALLGADRQNLAGRSFVDYVAEEDRAVFRQHLKHCCAGASPVKTELRLKTAAGVRDVELISVQPAREDPDGALYRSAITDITDRKRASEALRASEAELRWLLDNMPAVLWIRDRDGGARYVSANVKRVLGYAEHELRSGGARFWLNNVHPEDRERVCAAYARIFSDEAGGAAAYDIEYRRQARDGSWVWVVDRGMSVSEEHGVRYATGMFWDTTRRKRMQEQLRESEERFRQLAEHINEVFFLTDVDGRQILYVSPTFEKTWGYSAEKLYRNPASWLDIVDERDRKRVRRTVRTRRSHAPFDQEFRIRRPNGTKRWIRMRGFPIYDANGQVHRLAGIAVDVTARKEAGEALQRSHQKMRELALHLQSVREEERKRIAREIHDELGALLLAIKLDAEASRRRSPGRSATARARTLSELVSRVDAAIASVRRIATDLRPSILDNVGVVAAVEWEAQDMQRRTGITCEVEVDACDEELHLDPDRATAIFRIVQEALSNVAKHSKARHVKIALREGSDHVELTVADDGTGISKQIVSDRDRWGLVGMAERVNAFQGAFEIRPVEPHGTLIKATIPTGMTRPRQ